MTESKDAFSIIGARSGLRVKLLLELARNPGKEFTEAELARILNTTSSAVSKNLRPVAEGVLKDLLKTYNVFNNRVYKLEDNPLTRRLEISINQTLDSIQRVDNSIENIKQMADQFEELKKAREKGEISQKEYERRLASLDKYLEGE